MLGMHPSHPYAPQNVPVAQGVVNPVQLCGNAPHPQPWRVPLCPNSTSHLTSVPPLMLSQANHRVVRGFLWRLTLDSPDAHLSSVASALLAHVHTRQLRSILTHSGTQPPTLDAWLVMLARDTAARLAQLRQEALLPPAAAAEPAPAAAAEGASEGAADGAADEAAGAADGAAAVEPAAPQQGAVVAAAAPQWWDPPAVLAQPAASPEELERAVLHCERILKYLAMLVEECQVSRCTCMQVHGSCPCVAAPLRARLVGWLADGWQMLWRLPSPAPCLRLPSPMASIHSCALCCILPHPQSLPRCLPYCFARASACPARPPTAPPGAASP